MAFWYNLLPFAYLGVLGYIIGWVAKRLNGSGRARRNASASKKVNPSLAHLAFLHPHCNAGGGGERVLWSLIATLHRTYPNAQLSILSCESLDLESIVQRVKEHFGINIGVEKLEMKRLWSPRLLDPALWPRMTLLIQSLVSLLVGLEAAISCNSANLFIDTAGCAMAYPVLRLFGHHVVAYVHYPFISSEMIENVAKGKSDPINNSDSIASSPTLTEAKLAYYRALAWIYARSLSLSKQLFVNSSWTRAHLERISVQAPLLLLYPPCELQQVKEGHARRENLMVSLAQFRPEKNHRLQLEALQLLLQDYPEHQGKVKLVMIGGCRGETDEARVRELQAYADELGIGDSVEWQVGANQETVKEYLQTASIGLHSMRDEHFGMAIVESMAAGLLMIAHRSGGPMMDIVKDERVGLLADTPAEYAQSIHRLLTMPESERQVMRQGARKWCQERFDARLFERSFLKVYPQMLSY